MYNNLTATWLWDNELYQATHGHITKHNYANPLAGTGGQRLATRVDGEVYYLLGDHLGSTTVVADDQGNAVGYVLYDPYGEVITTTLPAAVTERLRTRDRPNP